MRKQYAASLEDLEKKLGRVMERLGVEKYQSNWTQGKGGSSCYVEMRYGASTYRFENSSAKSAACGRNLTYVSDLFAAVVYSLEGLARAVEQGIFTLDMLLVGVPALPEASKPLEPCFAAMGFTEMPSSPEQVKVQYRLMSKVLHPDAGGDAAAFSALARNYEACLAALKETDHGEV